MEDWLNFVECYSPYVFQQEHLTPLLYQLWELLAAATRHYCRPPPPHDLDDDGPPPTAEERAAAGRAHMLSFAVAVERAGFPASTFTNNLHMLVCR